MTELMRREDTRELETTTSTATPEPRTWASAPVDVFEGTDEFLVLADLPGVHAEDLGVQYEAGELRLEARRGTTDYRRTFKVSTSIDVDRIAAELSDGVLRVHLPKAETAKPRQIAVRTA